MTRARVEALPRFAWTRLRRPSGELPFPLGEPGCTLFSRARHALWQGVQAVGLAPGDHILAPAFHHGAEIEALLRAGLVCRYYEATPTLEPDQDELEALVDDRVRAVLLVHYLGFPQDGARWRAWCHERGLVLIEDCAQAWLSARDGHPVGSFGDLAVFSFHKTVGVPDGGAMLVRRPALPIVESRRALGVAPLVLRSTPSGDGASRPGAVDPTLELVLGNPRTPPAHATLFLLPRVVDEHIRSRRRANYEALLAELADAVPSPFRTLPAEASPFAFPLETDAKAQLLQRLAGRGIEALDLWPKAHPALPSGFAHAAARRSATACLPVHQDLRPEDLDRLIEATRPPHRRPPELELQPIDSLAQLRDDWRELAQRSENVFSTWEWTDAWVRHFSPRGRLLVTACRARDGRLVAILPLYFFAEGRFRIVRFLGHGPADELGPICALEDRPAARRALRRLLAQIQPDLFLAEQVPADEGWAAALAGRLLRHEGSPVLRFDGMDWESVLASRSANVRQQVRRFERRLTRAHDVRYRLADDPARLEDDLDLLFALHTERWRAGESAFSGPQAGFHREFARVAFERGWMRLWILEADGAPVSAWYGFRYGGVESYYQAGRDAAWERASVGFVLLAHSIRSAVEDGMREYRFLRGGEAFKYRFANADPGLETVGVARGRLAQAMLAATDALPASVNSSLRHWLSGTGQPPS